MSGERPLQVAFDIGGTFTDVSLVDGEGQVRTTKLLSLLDDVGPNIVRFLSQTLPGQPVSRFVHGTTTCSNAVIEGTTALTGLLTTRGFRDVLEMRGQRGPSAFLPDWRATEPLVPRYLRAEIDERIRADGSVERVLDLTQARADIERLVDHGVQAIAICLINSYENPEHERLLKDLVTEIAPDLPCCASVELDPAIKEYERTSTTAVNAALIPVVSDYLRRIRASLDALSTVLLIMQSNGGLVTSAAAVRRPAYLMESGPAAGVLAAAKLAEESGLNHAISFDMGGTTAKACLIEDGMPLEKAGTRVGPGLTAAAGFSGSAGGEGHVLRIPSLDVVEVGTGGGSIAWVDSGGALRVGPRSAGAEPGPACYGRGGSLPTVTDANLVLGYLNPEAIADSTIALDLRAAQHAITEHIARPLDMSLLEAAYGMIRVCNATMVRALRAVSTERGKDPRRCALIGFGGAGPLHAAALAEAMGIDEMHIPLNSGVFSSIGLLLADLRVNELTSVSAPLATLDGAELTAAYGRLEDRARERLLSQGAGDEEIRYERFADARYDFQISSDSIAMPSDVAGPELLTTLAELHGKAFEQQFGHLSGDPLIVENLRIRGTAPAGGILLPELYARTRERSAGAPYSRRAYFASTGLLDVAIYPVDGAPKACSGPAVIERADTTVLVPPGWHATRSAKLDSFILRRDAAETGQAR